VFPLVLDVQVSERVEATVGWRFPRFDTIGSFRGELSCGALVGCFLANTDRRAASKTRAERKMEAVREVAALEGKSRASVTPRVSRGSASTQEERHSRRLRGRAVVTTMVSGAVVWDVAEEAKTLRDLPGDRNTLSSRSTGTSSSQTKRSLRIGEREQLEGRQRVFPGRTLEHLSWLTFSGPYNIEQNSKLNFLSWSSSELHISRSSGAEPWTSGSSRDEQTLMVCVGG